MARLYRDAKFLEIGKGTSGIQRLVISCKPSPAWLLQCSMSIENHLLTGV